MAKRRTKIVNAPREPARQRCYARRDRALSPRAATIPTVGCPSAGMRTLRTVLRAPYSVPMVL